MKNKFNYLLKLLLILLSLSFSSCDKDLYDDSIKNNNYQDRIKIETKSLNDLQFDVNFKKAFDRLPKKKESSSIVTGRTFLEEQYYFKIIDAPIKVANFDGRTTYTLMVERDETSDNKLENLVLYANPNDNEIGYFIKYNTDKTVFKTEQEIKDSGLISIEKIDNSETSDFQQRIFIIATWISNCTASGVQFCNGNPLHNWFRPQCAGGHYVYSTYQYDQDAVLPSDAPIITFDGIVDPFENSNVLSSPTGLSLVSLEIKKFFKNVITPEQNQWYIDNPDVHQSVNEFLTDNGATIESQEFLQGFIDVVRSDSTTDVNAFKFVLQAQSQDKIYHDLDDVFLTSVDNLIDVDVASYMLANPTDPLWIHFTIQCAVLRANHPDWSDLKIYWEASKEFVHITLDALGLVPLFGEVADLTNGVLYLIEGDGVNASLSVASAVPLAGWASVSTKYAIKIIDASQTATTIATRVKLTWKVVGNTIEFGNRGQLRKVLGITSSLLQAHHLIPWSSQTKMVVQRAAKYGSAFHMNEALNGIAVASWRNQPNHQAYNNLINSKLDAFRDLNPNATPQECYEFLTDLIQDIRNWIVNNPNSHLNEIVLP